MILAFIFVLIIFLFLTIQYSIFLPPVKGLPILMYHKASLNVNDALTVSIPNLEQHFKYLSNEGYTCLPFTKVIELNNSELPKHSFVLTFDDAYLNNLEYLYPLLKKYNFHATIMLPVGFLGKVNEWDHGNEPIMNYEQLLSMDNTYVSFGLHTYAHIPLKNSSFDVITNDLEKCKLNLNANGINYLPILAYPYGGYPKSKDKKDLFFDLLKKNGIDYGLRIGNKINKWPIKNKYEVKRIDIKGDDSFWAFKIKLKKGRVKLF